MGKILLFDDGEGEKTATTPKGRIKAQMGVIYFADNCGPSDFALNESLDHPPVFFPERGGFSGEGGSSAARLAPIAETSERSSTIALHTERFEAPECCVRAINIKRNANAVFSRNLPATFPDDIGLYRTIS